MFLESILLAENEGRSVASVAAGGHLGGSFVTSAGNSDPGEVFFTTIYDNGSMNTIEVFSALLVDDGPV